MLNKAALYIRLSKEDKNESINNQKQLLIKYASEIISLSMIFILMMVIPELTLIDQHLINY